MASDLAPSVDFSAVNIVDQGRLSLEDPVISVNPNMGGFNTGFYIPLPRNFTKLTALNFSYSSLNSLNKGYGVGFNLVLPSIMPNHSTDGRLPYIYTGLDSGELVYTGDVSSENLQEVTSILYNVLNKQQTHVLQQYRFEEYRPFVDNNFNLFVRFIDQTSKDEGWIILEPSGARWILSRVGRPVFLLDVHQNWLSFTWQNGVLTSVTDQESAWTLRLEYMYDVEEASKRVLPTYVDQAFAFIPSKLDSVKLEIEKEDKNIVDSYKFTYTDNYLSAVKKDGAIFPIFNVKYNSIYPSTPILTENAKPASSDSWIDFNTDGIPDALDINFDAFNKLFPYDFAFNLNFQASEKSIAAFKRDIATSLINVARVKLSEGNSFVVDNKMSSLIAKYMGEAIVEYNNQYHAPRDVCLPDVLCKKEEHYFPKVEKVYFARKVFTADINGDGKQDVISCPNISQIDKTQFKRKDGKPISNLVAEILLENGLTDIPVGSFAKPSQYQGKLGLISIQKRNEQSSIRQSINRIFRLEETKTNLLCHQYSLFSDFNKDGFADVLTGSTVYLGDGTGYFYPQPQFDYHNLFSSQQKSVDINKDLILLDLNNDGKMEVINGSHVDGLSKKGILSVFSGDERSDYKIAPNVMILSEVLSPFGSLKRIHYDIENGSYRLKKVETLGDDLVSSESYSYRSPNYNRETNQFIGYAKVARVVENGTSAQEDKRIEFKYATDLGRKNFIAGERGKLNGLLLVKKTFPKNTSNDPRMRMTCLQYNFAQLGDDRIFPYIEKTAHTVDSSCDGNDISVAQIATEDIFSFVDWHKKNDGRLIYPLGKRKLHRAYLEVLPPGLNDFVNLDMSVRKTEECYSSKISNRYLFVEDYCIAKDHKGVAPYVKVRNSYNEDGQLESQCRGERCTWFDYDQLGRLEFVKSNVIDGEGIKFTYFANTPLVETASDEKGESEFTFDELGYKLVTHKTPDHNLFSYLWNKDGLLAEYKINAISHYKLKSLTASDADVLVNETHVSLFFDAFGRVRLKHLNGPDGIVSSGVSSFGHDGSLLSKMENLFEGNTRNPNIEVLLQYDYLGQVVNEEAYPGTDSHSSFNYKREQLTVEKKLDDLLIESSTVNVAQDREFRNTYMNEEYEFLLDINNNITSLIGDGAEILRWSHDEYGQVTRFVDLTSDIYGEKLSLRNISPLGNTIDYPGIMSVESRFDGQIKAVDSESLPVLSLRTRYDKGRLIESDSFAKSNLSQSAIHRAYTYEKNRIASETVGNLSRTFKFDAYDRISTIIVKDPSRKIDSNRKLTYSRNLTSSVSPFISNIQYDAYDRITKVIYKNGSTLRRSYFANGILKSVEMSDGDLNLFSEEYTLNNENKYATTHTRVKPFGIDSGAIPHIYVNQRIQKIYQSGGNNVVDPDDYLVDGNLKSLPSVDFISTNFFYDHNGTLMIACADGLSPDSEDCYKSIDNNSFTYKGYFVEAIKVNGIMLGILINNNFFPVIEDKIGSIRAMFFNNAMLWHRSFSDWGEKGTPTFNQGELKNLALFTENITIWNFAKLITPPNYTKSKISPELYWSLSRVYSPSRGRWLTTDPMGKWSPNLFIKQKGNWDLTRYCNDDPVNFVDPSGYWAHIAIGAGIGGVAGGLSAHYAGARGWDLVNASLIGAASGAASATGVGGILGGMFLGLTSNVGTQLVTGTSPDNLNLNSIAISTLSAGIGAGVGSLASKYMQVPMKYFSSIDTIGFNWLNSSDKIISSAFAGTIGGSLDFGLHNSFGDRSNDIGRYESMDIDLGIFDGPNPYSTNN